MAKAAGVKFSSSSSATPQLPTSSSTIAPESSKRSGWATVGSSTGSTTAPEAVKTGGWAKIGQPPPPPPDLPPPPPPPDLPPPPPSDPPPPLPHISSPPRSSGHMMKFRSSGFKNLTHQLEERAIVDTENLEADSRMSVDKEDASGAFPSGTPAWRSHLAPSPSPHLGSVAAAASSYFPTEDHPMPDVQRSPPARKSRWDS